MFAGTIAGFGIPRDSRLAALLMIGSAQICSVMNIGVLTAAAQNATMLGFTQRLLGASVTWFDWLIAALPFWLIMAPVTAIILWRFHTPEIDRIEGGAAAIRADLAKLGPMSAKEKRTLLVGAALLMTWATEGRLHGIDTASSTIIAVAVLLLPGIGVMGWKQAQAGVPPGAPWSCSGSAFRSARCWSPPAAPPGSAA